MAVSDRLELELSERLARVEAPGELWELVRPPARPEPRPRRAWTAWPIAAGVMILIAAGTFFLAAKGAPPAPRPHESACLSCHISL